MTIPARATKPTKSTGLTRRIIEYSSCSAATPRRISPSARISPPEITMNSAKAIAGIA